MGLDLIQVWEFLRTFLPWKRIQRWLLDLAGRKALALSTCIFLLVASVGFTWWYLRRAINYEAVLRKTLSTKLMPTPQKFKGLEAFVLSNVDEQVVKRSRTLRIGPHFADSWAKLESDLLRATLPPLPCAAPDADPNACLRPQLRRAAGKNKGLILTDDAEQGFLFLPINVLRPSLTHEELRILDPMSRAMQEDVARILNTAIEMDYELLKDIAFTARAAGHLQGLVSQTIVDPNDTSGLANLFDTKPTQAYIITKNGVIRIFNNYNEKPESQYGSQFPPTTFFPSRPYFWPPFAESKVTEGEELEPKHMVGEEATRFFWISAPYVDLGGNGIILTLARGIHVDGLPRTVICLDLKVQPPSQLTTVLEQQLSRFGEKLSRITCTVRDAGGESCTPGANADTTLLRQMTTYVSNLNAHNERSELFGNIQIIELSAGGSGPLVVSVPLSETSNSDSQTGEFLVFKLDLTRFRRRTTWIGFSAASGFGLFTALLVLLWARSVRGEQAWQEALSGVERVLGASPTAYVRLDNQDEILAANEAFYSLLGVNREHLGRSKFEGLCADDQSRKMYRQVQEARKRGDSVAPYDLLLKHGGGGEVSVKVISAAVPSPNVGKLPETFGILLARNMSAPIATSGASSRG